MAEVSCHLMQDLPLATFLNRAGEGHPDAVLFIHGSGPGATAWSNWQHVLPVLGDYFDCLAPDLIGFGQSAHPDPPPIGMTAWMRLWVQQLLSVLDALRMSAVHVVGNSLGGAIALHLLMEQPERFRRIVLMGSVGAPMRLTRTLDLIWGFYEDPSLRRMTQLISWFAYDDEVIGDRLEEIARMRYEAAMMPAVRRSYTAMFPAPRQKHLDELVVPETALKRISHSVMLVHGRDDSIVPIETSWYLLNHLGGDVQLHIFGRCGHWVQIEHRERFHRLLHEFLSKG